jgi:hypothetical protein
MTARKAAPKAKVCIVINRAKARLTAAAADKPVDMAPANIPGTAIIKGLQAAMLDALVTAGGRAMTRTELITASGASESTARRPFVDLRERELIDVAERAGERGMQLITINAKGRKALWSYHQAEANHTRHAATPARTHISTDPYTPTASAYYRNSGHPHIASHGVRC